MINKWLIGNMGTDADIYNMRFLLRIFDCKDTSEYISFSDKKQDSKASGFAHQWGHYFSSQKLSIMLSDHTSYQCRMDQMSCIHVRGQPAVIPCSFCAENKYLCIVILLKCEECTWQVRMLCGVVPCKHLFAMQWRYF